MNACKIDFIRLQKWIRGNYSDSEFKIRDDDVESAIFSMITFDGFSLIDI